MIKSYIKYLVVILISFISIIIVAYVKPCEEVVEISEKEHYDVEFPDVDFYSDLKKVNINHKKETVCETNNEIEFNETILYSSTSLNIRTGPGEEFDIVNTVPANFEFVVLDYDKDHIWDMIRLDDNYYFVCSKYLSEEQVEIKEIVISNFTNYGIWCGAWYHFTPEQWDNKKGLEQGTAKSWQNYLYAKLSEKGLSWWYKYAVAQALQESGWNPYNNINHTIISWLAGEATYDCGLFSFKTKYWNQQYGDVFDYKANINAYIDKIAPYLTDTSISTISKAIAQHYDPYVYHQEYVDAVLSRLNELWEQ